VRTKRPGVTVRSGRATGTNQEQEDPGREARIAATRDGEAGSGSFYRYRVSLRAVATGEYIHSQ